MRKAESRRPKGEISSKSEVRNPKLPHARSPGIVAYRYMVAYLLSLLGYFRHSKLAGRQQHGGGGNEFTAGNFIGRSHNEAQCKSQPDKSKRKKQALGWLWAALPGACGEPQGSLGVASG